MPSSVSISLVILVWITIIIIINHVGSANTTVAKPQSSPLAQEAKALGSWRRRYEESTSSPCKWDGIVCNDGGSVIEININGTDWYQDVQFCDFSFSSFPNLVRFKLARRGLHESIPPEIGSVAELTYLGIVFQVNYLSHSRNSLN